MLRKYISILLCLISFQNLLAQGESTISDKDFESLVGDWKGTITYLDYTTNKAFSMPAELEVRHGVKQSTYVFANKYPDEPNANESDTITLAANRRMINREFIRSKRNIADGRMEIITEYLATDGNDNKPAIIRHSYLIGKDVYINRKEVKFALQDDWIKRSEYSYTRKKLVK